MRFERATFHNIGPFEHFTLDLSHHEDDLLIAVCGVNGAGKSFALESAIAGALYRTMPTQGSLAKRATAKDSYVESRIVSDAVWTIRHTLDSVSGKAEVLVLDEAGRTALDTTSVRAFDAWAAAHFPPAEVLFASVFAAQGQERFLSANPTERKTILLRVLGIERLEALTERARGHMRDAKSAVDTIRLRISDERKRGGDVAGVAAEIPGLEEVAAAESRKVDEARRDLEFARSGAPALEMARREAVAQRAKRAELVERIASKRSELQVLETRIQNNRGVLDEAEAIRTAVARTEELSAQVAKLKAELDGFRAQGEAAVVARDQHGATERNAKSRAAEARQRAAKARARLQDREAVQAAAAAVPGLESARQAAMDRETEARDEVERVRGERVTGAEGRIVLLRDGLTKIVRLTGGSPVDIATEALDRDDATVRAEVELPERLRVAQALCAEAIRANNAARAELNDSKILAARVGEIEAAAREAEQADRDAQAADLEATNAGLAKASAQVDVDARATDVAKKNRAVVAATDEAKGLEAVASKGPRLATVEGRLAELEPQVTAARAEIARLEVALSETPEPPAEVTLPDVAALEARAAAAEQSAKDAAAALMLAQAQLEVARQSAEAVAALEREQATAEDELADWTSLTADLGRDGLQAMEVDACGGELTELVNDLLRTFGSRWSISIETTKLSADGKRQLEGCEALVLDTVDGREADGKLFSGGQKVILDEAMSLALTMLACRRGGLKGITLVRDESGAALDPDNARAYVTMLRRAAELVDAKHVLFVSHSPEIQEMADARIEIPSRAGVAVAAE